MCAKPAAACHGLDLAGYTPGLPPWLSAEASAVDRLVARQARCPSCRTRGLEFRPHHRHLPRSYKVLLSCPRCACTEEL